MKHVQRRQFRANAGALLSLCRRPSASAIGENTALRAQKRERGGGGEENQHQPTSERTLPSRLLSHLFSRYIPVTLEIAIGSALGPRHEVCALAPLWRRHLMIAGFCQRLRPSASINRLQDPHPPEAAHKHAIGHC